MKHVLYGLFEDEERASAAQQEIERAGCNVTMLRSTPDESALPLAETGMAEGVLHGFALGGVLGATAGALVAGPLGIAASPAAVATLAGVAGAAEGGIMVAIAESTGSDRTLKRMSRRLEAGRAILTVEAPSLTAAEQAALAIERSGGSVQKKPVW